jgi:uncharacterized protein
MTRKTLTQNQRVGVDWFGRTPLHYSASEGNAESVAHLIGEGADPNAKDKNGWSPLHFASQAGSGPVVQLLLNANAVVEEPDSNGNTPLFRAVFNSKGDGTIISLLRQAGADALRENKHGVSPLDLARAIANYDVAQFFSDLP